MKVFKEEQRFTQSWVIALLIISTMVPLVIVFSAYFKDENTMETSEFVTVLSVIFVATSLIFFFKLKTRIDEKGLYYQFFPFHFSLKLIPWTEIKSAQIRTYDAITEYGGWGLRSWALWNRKRGKSITISGNKGIQLILRDGQKLLIGTQKEQEANQVLKTYINKTESNEI